MADLVKFKHKSGSITSVFTQQNIDYLRGNPDYTEIKEEADEKPVVNNTDELMTGEPIVASPKPKTSKKVAK